MIKVGVVIFREERRYVYKFKGLDAMFYSRCGCMPKLRAVTHKGLLLLHPLFTHTKKYFFIFYLFIQVS